MQRQILKLPFLPSEERVLSWTGSFFHCLFLNSNREQAGQEDNYTRYDWLAAAGTTGNEPEFVRNLEDLSKNFRAHHDWLFGHLSYDLKNSIHDLTSGHPDGIGFPDILFFRPRYVLTRKGKVAELHYFRELENDDSIAEILHDLSKPDILYDHPYNSVDLKERMPKEAYLKAARRFLEHIQRGDIYEANFCVEFFNENTSIHPLRTHMRLNAISPMPHSAYYRIEENHLLCASPERYLAKRGNTLISQPIKGTKRRGMNNEEDEAIMASLRSDPKELAENVMIVDLVRNDLSIVAERGSVKAERLFEIHTFRNVHQLVSTVTAELKSGSSLSDAIRSTFPMGSMTGAPKKRAMEIIEKLETTRRGLYSGSVGYIEPGGDFDFNVVIRSIQYNEAKRYTSVMAGGALTAAADPEKEYEECLLKAETMRRALGG